MKSQWSLLGYAVQERRGLAVVVAVMVLGIGLDLLRPWPTKLLVDQVLGQQPGTSDLDRWIALLPGPGGRDGLLLWVCVSTILIFLVGTLTSLVSNVASVSVGQRMTYNLGADLFVHLQRLSLRFHRRQSVGDTISRVTGDAYCVQTLVMGVKSGERVDQQTYAAAYYRGWPRRTTRFAGPLHQEFRWLAALCARSKEFLTSLLAAPPTVIHGEYYPENILFRRGSIYPIDWESAAIAAGEVDLASLTEGWPAEVIEDGARDYRRARWPEGAPAGFETRLDVARLYLHLRWLGDRPEWTTHEYCRWRFAHLHSVGERLGLI